MLSISYLISIFIIQFLIFPFSVERKIWLWKESTALTVRHENVHRNPKRVFGGMNYHLFHKHAAFYISYCSNKLQMQERNVLESVASVLGTVITTDPIPVVCVLSFQHYAATNSGIDSFHSLSDAHYSLTIDPPVTYCGKANNRFRRRDDKKPRRRETKKSRPTNTAASSGKRQSKRFTK